MLLSLPLLLSVLMSCRPDDKPRINYAAKTDSAMIPADFVLDSSVNLVASLPIRFDKTEILLTTIGVIDLEQRDPYSGSYVYKGGQMSGMGETQLNDYLNSTLIANIVFQGTASDERLLTDKKVCITGVAFLRPIFENLNQQYLLYYVADHDSNGDGQLNNGDILSLYISALDGTGFKKITQDLHQASDFKVVAEQNRVYFRTIEDRNKDGKFNNKDRFYYYTIDFSETGYEVAAYNPLRLLE